jgi:hypothetical protein
MSELPFQKQAELWGQAYEVLVKRGVLACLVDWKLIDPAHAMLQPWRETQLLDVTKALAQQLGILDETVRDEIKAAVEHMALTAFGVGYTATREYLRSIGKPLKNGKLKLRALWCPLMLPGDSKEPSERMARDRTLFHEQFAMQGIVDEALSAKGQPANADFVLWLSGEYKEDHLLVQEYSFDMPREIPDYRDQEAHLDELMRHRRLIDNRSVFARVTAEVEGESFELSEDIRHHLGALTSGNKPFYKLCQACAYAESTAAWLRRDGVLNKPCVVRALAITPNGLESLAAHFLAVSTKEPRRQLMEQMGKAYRETRKLVDGDEDGLTEQVESVFVNVLRRLPRELKAGMRALRRMPQPGEDYSFTFEETVPEFANPADEYDFAVAQAMVDDTPALKEFFGRPAPEAVGALMAKRLTAEGKVSLRDMHAAAIVAGMQRSLSGQVNVLALEGNPGIGKTTAVRTYLENKPEGFLFLYVSPRVVINRDVTHSLAQRDGQLSGILTVTTNAKLIAAAPRWHLNEVNAGRTEYKHVDGAVVADGVKNLRKPDGSVLVISPEQEQEIEAAHAGSRIAKTTISENEDMVEERSLVGVLSGMAGTTRELLEFNPDIQRVVMTAALQGFREKGGGKTTMDALSKLFKAKAADPAGIRERKAFAQRVPNIVVMVDELAGDGAGAPFVHAVARWLSNEFIQCFEDEPSPFTVTLVVSDASLGNDVVLNRYLNAGDRAPDKVLVSKSRGKRAFALAVSDVGIGNGPKRTLHVMTNSYPASALSITYKVNLTQVRPERKAEGQLETARQAIRRLAGEHILAGAKAEILGALDKGARQVIYFAQDKNFLGDLRNTLAGEPGLSRETVQVLDSSVPESTRHRLVSPMVRDKVKVFLMTSSGARGVSFPKTDWILAAVPRFNIEAALMEIAQLIYRGRGYYVNEEGETVSGDKVPRRLVMLVDDYLMSEDGIDPRQWLRQSIDLMTLLVMLRSTILTRITGDAGLRQSLALVPVGAVGLEELVSLMSQYVTQFVGEADVIWRRISDQEKVGLVRNAQANVIELFSHTKLQAAARKGSDRRTMVRYEDAKALCDQTTMGIKPLLVYAAEGTSIPDHVHVCGPAFLENWGDFDKLEVFSFEGHTTEVTQTGRRVIAQLLAIDEDRSLPGSLRQPAINLLRLLQREKKDAANEFNTLKNLKSPNTWISVPTGYVQFMAVERMTEGRPFEVVDPDMWLEGLAQGLAATSAVMPPIARYAEFPWAASVGNANPLKLDTVFDDRYFMASNELNLLNTLLLADSESPE